jgi:drug/metabolite transporter (DMT)-like permease
MELLKVSRIARATVLVLVASLSFGAISVLTVLTARGGLQLIDAMVWRYVLGVVVLGLRSSPRQIAEIPIRKIAVLIVIGGGGQALITFVSLSSLEYISVGTLAFLFYTYPAWVALLQSLTGAEKLTLPRLAALALALGGIAVMMGSPGTASLNIAGVLLALGASVLYAFYLPLLQRMQRGVPAQNTVFLIVIGAALSFLGSGLMKGHISVPAGGAVWTNILLLAVVSTGIAFTALLAGLSVLGPVRTAIIATIEPFFTALLGVIVLRGSLRVTTLLGGALIVAAVLVIEWSSNVRRAKLAG